MAWLLFGIFTGAGLAAVAAAWTGFSGEAGDRDLGYDLPARVVADPARRREANRLVARWCTAAAVLSALPLVLLAVRGLHEPVPLPLLVAHAAHGFVVVLVGSHPFERIRQLARD